VYTTLCPCKLKAQKTFILPSFTCTASESTSTFSYSVTEEFLKAVFDQLVVMCNAVDDST